MRNEMYSIKCPSRIQFGDSLYFEEYEGKRLSDLVVDFKPPAHFHARIGLTETELKEYPGFMNRMMTICLNRKVRHETDLALKGNDYRKVCRTINMVEAFSQPAMSVEDKMKSFIQCLYTPKSFMLPMPVSPVENA